MANEKLERLHELQALVGRASRVHDRLAVPVTLTFGATVITRTLDLGLVRTMTNDTDIRFGFGEHDGALYLSMDSVPLLIAKLSALYVQA